MQSPDHQLLCAQMDCEAQILKSDLQIIKKVCYPVRQRRIARLFSDQASRPVLYLVYFPRLWQQEGLAADDPEIIYI